MLGTNITDSELLVFHVVLMADAEIALTDIMAILEERYHNGWARSTVCTFMSHLTEKGYVQSRRQGRQFFYSPIVDREHFVMEQLVNFCDIYFDGDIKGMITAACRTRGVDKERAAEIEKQIAKF